MSGSIKQAFGGLVIGVYNFVISVLVTRILDPRDFGIYSMATSIVYFLMIFREFGFPIAATNIDENNRDVFGTYFTITIIIEGIFIFLAGILYYFLKRIYGFDVSVSFIAIAFINSLTSIKLVFQTENLKSGRFAINTESILVSNLLKGFVVLFLATRGFGFYALLIGDFLMVLLQLIMFYYHSGFRPFFFINKQIFKKFVNFAKRQIVNTPIGIFSGYMHKFVMGNLSGLYNLGFYEKAYSLTFFTRMNVIDYILQVAGPTYAKFKNNNELSGYLYLFSKNIARIAFFVSAILFVCIPEFVKIFWTEKWLGVVWNLRMMVVSGALQPVTVNYEVFFSYLGYPNFNLFTAMTFLLFTNLIGVVLTFHFTPYGMAFALSIASVFSYIVASMILNKRFIKFNTFQPIKTSLIAFLFVSATGIVFERFVYFNDVFMFLFKLIISSIWFILITFLIEKREFVDEVKKIFYVLKYR